jgi:excisionase family DNA binding protein
MMMSRPVNVLDKELLTPAEVAEYLRYSLLSVYRKLKNGEIPSVKLGRQWRIPSALFQQYLDKRLQGDVK